MSTGARIEEYDLVILGGGTGGTVAAWTFATEGRSVAVIERKYIGGSCPNIACLPSKNIIQSAKVASYFLSETRGFLKALVEIRSDRILGFTGFGAGAAEIMTSVQMAMNAGVPYTALRDTILTHPTLVEGLIPLFSSSSSMQDATGEDARAGLKQKTVSR